MTKIRNIQQLKSLFDESKRKRYGAERERAASKRKTALIRDLINGKISSHDVEEDPLLSNQLRSELAGSAMLKFELGKRLPSIVPAYEKEFGENTIINILGAGGG